MDLVAQDLSTNKRLPRFVMPIILDEFLHRLLPHLEKYE
jgi:hypothetical protein